MSCHAAQSLHHWCLYSILSLSFTYQLLVIIYYFKLILFVLMHLYLYFKLSDINLLLLQAYLTLPDFFPRSNPGIKVTLVFVYDNNNNINNRVGKLFIQTRQLLRQISRHLFYRLIGIIMKSLKYFWIVARFCRCHMMFVVGKIFYL